MTFINDEFLIAILEDGASIGGGAGAVVAVLAPNRVVLDNPMRHIRSA